MKKGFTLVEILMVTAIFSLLAIIAIPSIIRARVLANDVFAQTTLRNIGTALEAYNHQNHQYPSAMNDLLIATPPYLGKDYFSSAVTGFTYVVNGLSDSTYSIAATPVNIGTTGTTTYTITTGGLLQ